SRLNCTWERNPNMLAWILNAAYLAILVGLSPAIAWAAWRTGKYREGYREKLLGLVPRRAGQRFCVWVHAVSVGEVNLLATTLRELAERRPDWEVVLSTTTKTGYELARRKYGQRHTVFYCPLDFSWAVGRAMRRVRPDLLVLAELELWPNLIAAARRHGAQVAVINGRLSENSFRGYQRIGWLAKRVLKQINLIASQDQATADRFLALGASRGTVQVTGSLKYDGAETNRENPRTQELRNLAGLTSDHVVLLAGSTQAPEEAFAIETFQRLHPEFPALRLVLVPRHPERFDEVARLLHESGIPWVRRSQLQSAIPNPQSAILVDTIGELGAWWGVADIGFVGGSFGDRGGQNMIEPAAYGVATCFGPNTRNFRDIVAALLTAGGAVVVNDAEQLEALVWHCLSDRVYAAALGERARRFVATQLGATRRTLDMLEAIGPPADARRSAA
ncbi:MAG: 3-deoxy-D-manno-octulosonic acid transferase, partial [Planctomycetales bacterium]|nr:3-deoxy-D-manno-octulosonic acid transferase [Planctomycetales bacterium]